MLLQGKSMALISDAGTPLISDPGYKLINFLRENNQKIICIPGCSSLTASISISGIACDNFLFLGFLPTKIKSKKDLLKNISPNYSFIFFESANRLIESIEIINEIDSSRKICVAKELTKIYEETFFGESNNLLNILKNNSEKIRGELVVLVEKQSKNFKINFETLNEEIKNLLLKNKSAKEICEELTFIHEINKKELYQRIIDIKNNLYA
jgi:16S rRNA (cytidine1402-2'-O)-methyltransferase